MEERVARAHTQVFAHEGVQRLHIVCETHRVIQSIVPHQIGFRLLYDGG